MRNNKANNKISIILFLIGIVMCFIFDNYIKEHLLIMMSNSKTSREVINGWNDMDVIGERGYTTSGTDPWIIISTQDNTTILVDMDLVDDTPVKGKIYYRAKTENFEEARTFSYTFCEGKNLIQVPDDVYEIRLDIEQEEEASFSINTIWYCGSHALFVYSYITDFFWGVLLLYLIYRMISLFKIARILEKDLERNLYIRYIFDHLLLFSIMIVFKDYILGRNYFMFRDVGSDTVEQYYPFFINMVDNIREGTWGAWNWEYGLGTSLGGQTNLLSDPFNLLIVLGGLIGGTIVIKYMLLISHLLKIVVAFFLCRYFIENMGKTEIAANIAAYLYAFNGYIMLWGQHYQLGGGVVYIILVLILIEKLIECPQKKWVNFLSIIIALSIVANYYNGYMILLFAAIYFLFRLFRPNRKADFKENIMIMIKCLFAAISGIMISAVTLLPAVYSVFVNSSRISGESRGWYFWGKMFFSFPSWDRMGMIISRLLSNNILFINNPTEEVNGWATNYYEMPNLAFSCIIFIVIFQVLFVKIRNCKTRKEYSYLICVCIVSVLLLFNQGIQMAFNSFAYVSYRYTFVLFPIFAILFAEFWDECVSKAQINICALMLGVCMTIVAWMFSKKYASDEIVLYRQQLFFIVILITCIMTWIWKYKRVNKIVISIMLFTVIFSTISENYITNNQRNMQTSSEYTLRYSDKGIISNDTKEALAYLKMIDSSLYRVEKTYSDWTILADSLIDGYAGVNCYNGIMNSKVLDYYANVYEGSYINRAICIFTLDNISNVQAISLVNVKYILSKTQLNYQWCEYVGKVGTIYIYRNIKADSLGRWYNSAITKEEYENADWKIRQKILETNVIVEDEKKVIIGNSESECNMSEFYMVKPTHIIGKIVNSGRGILHIAIPDEDGWEIYVDGKKVETINVNYGFIGVLLDEGKHVIEAKYTLPFFREGVLLSVLGCLCLTMYNVLEKRKNII